jgi:hypothetical protein
MAGDTAQGEKLENGSCASASGGALGTKAFNTPMYVHVFAENGEALVTGADWMYDKIEWATVDDREKNFEELDLLPRLEIMRYNLKHFVECVRNGVGPSFDAETSTACVSWVT